MTFPRDKLVLAGDIGGTKTLLQLCRFSSGGECRIIHEERYDSKAHGGLAPLLRAFMNAASSAAVPAAACFGVAGPVEGRRAGLTNLPWQIDAAEISREFGIPAVRLINDFEAIGYGIEALVPGDLVTLQEGKAGGNLNRVVIGAGTGLGVGLLVWRGDGYEVLASEGGHVDFAPQDDLQIGLWRHLSQQFGHVSYERLLSGGGLFHIYSFLRDSGRVESPELRLAMQAGDPAATIAGFALRGEDPLAMLALDTFTAIYGAQAGNLALTMLAGGGVYVAGGIAPKIIDRIKEGGFMRAFLNKGRYANFMATVPVHVVMNQKAGLLGAARCAASLISKA